MTAPLSLKLPKIILDNFAKTKELPWVAPNHLFQEGTLESLDSMLEHRYVAPEKGSNWQALFAESWMIFDQSCDFANLIANKADWNIIELAESNGASIWPLTFELAEQNCLSGYVSVTMNDLWNKVAGLRTNQMLQESGLSPVQVASIKADMDFDIIQKDLLKYQAKIDKPTHNLFVLQASLLSNIIDPYKYLYNIYNSMVEGDFLLLSQSIYNPEMIQDLTLGFQSLYSVSMEDQKKVIEYFGHLENSWMAWHEDKNTSGLKVKVKLDRDILLENCLLEKGEEITIFKNNVYTRAYLEDLMKKVGFKIKYLSINFAQTSALYLLEK